MSLRSVRSCRYCQGEVAYYVGRGLACRSCGRSVDAAPVAAAAAGPVFVLGLDLGQASDFTALAALQQTFGPDQHLPGRTVSHYAVRHLERLKLGTSYVEMMATVKGRVENPPLRGHTMAVDQTGVGRPVVDMLRIANLPVTLRPITITFGHTVTEDAEDLSYHVPKKELVSTLQVLLQGGRLKIARSLPEAKVLQDELLNFKVKLTAAANETFGAWRERDHDDLVLAVALAAWLGERTPGPFTVGKPAEKQGSLVDQLPEGVFARR